MVVLGIRAKILILILISTIGPLLLLNLFWTNSQRQALIKDTTSRQALVTQKDATSVNDFLNEKVRTLIIHSQSPSLEQFDKANAELAISTLLYQDKDLDRVSFVDQNGQEQIALTGDLKPSPLANVKDSDAFRVVNYFGGNQYISPVSFDTNGHPMVTIAVPIVYFTSPQQLGSLSTAEPGVVRNPQDIKGALIASVNLENLWSSVLSTASTKDAYAYVVDDKGIVIAHPDEALLNAHKDFSATPIVALFKRNLGSTHATSGTIEGTSEKGVHVVATYQSILATNWGVVFEEPVNSIYANVTHVLKLGLGISAVAILALGAISVWLSSYLADPVLRIARAAERIGRGDFTGRFAMKRRDEIGQLSLSVNSMGQNLQTYIGRIEMQRHQLEVILNSTTDGILAVDEQGIIVIANQAAANLSERLPAELVGQDITQIFPWKQPDEQPLISYRQPGTHLYRDLHYMAPGGSVHYINLIVVKAGLQTIVTIHDETKSRELEDMKVDFVSMAAHELRTPLARIRGYLEIIGAHPPTRDADPALEKYIRYARQSATELSSLISSLLDVARIERGTLVLTMEKVDLADMLAQATHNFQQTASEKRITVSYKGPESGSYVIADPIVLREVFDNLIDNAIKYTPQQGQVRVSLAERAGAYAVDIADTGIGIPANALPYLFTKFYRVHGGLESGSKGTGLGLYISKSIIERHDGAIAVQSNEGRGSVFTVTMPKFNEEKFLRTQTQQEGATHDNRRRGWATKNIAR